MDLFFINAKPLCSVPKTDLWEIPENGRKEATVKSVGILPAPEYETSPTGKVNDFFQGSGGGDSLLCPKFTKSSLVDEEE